MLLKLQLNNCKTLISYKKAAKVVTDSPEAILSRLQAIRSEIHKLEKEYNGLKKKL
jgi:uncharacterized protein YukE